MTSKMTSIWSTSNPLPFCLGKINKVGGGGGSDSVKVGSSPSPHVNNLAAVILRWNLGGPSVYGVGQARIQPRAEGVLFTKGGFYFQLTGCGLHKYHYVYKQTQKEV
jgi:hypothetical protein